MQAIKAIGETSIERSRWWEIYERKMSPCSPERMELNRLNMVNDPVLQELCPLSVLSLKGELPEDVEYQSLHQEDIAYGQYLIENNIAAVGMFECRALAAANEDNAEWERICLAIENFNIEAIEGVYGH